MAEDGIVGEFKKGEPREVLYSWEEWEASERNRVAARSGGVMPQARYSLQTSSRHRLRRRGGDHLVQAWAFHLVPFQRRSLIEAKSMAMRSKSASSRPSSRLSRTTRITTP